MRPFVRRATDFRDLAELVHTTKTESDAERAGYSPRRRWMRPNEGTMETVRTMGTTGGRNGQRMGCNGGLVPSVPSAILPEQTNSPRLFQTPIFLETVCKLLGLTGHDGTRTASSGEIGPSGMRAGPSDGWPRGRGSGHFDTYSATTYDKAQHGRGRGRVGGPVPGDGLGRASAGGRSGGWP